MTKRSAATPLLQQLRAKIQACVDADNLEYIGGTDEERHAKLDAGLDLDDFVMEHGEDLLLALSAVSETVTPAQAELALIDRMRKWAYTIPRKPAEAAFTAGLERQIAYMIEDAEGRRSATRPAMPMWLVKFEGQPQAAYWREVQAQVYASGYSHPELVEVIAGEWRPV